MTKSLQKELDNDFKQIGEFGIYQFVILLLVGLTSAIPAILAYSYVFIGATPDYRCALPNYTNDTYKVMDENHQYLVDVYIPINDDNEYEKCLIYDHLKYDNISDRSNLTRKGKCDKWVFSKDYYEQTIVTDWELFCDKTAKKNTFSTMYFLGLYGILIMGIISDKIGRKKCVYVYMCINAIVNILIALVVNLEINIDIKQILYAILRFLTGAFCNFYSIGLVLGVELTGPKYRVTAANAIYYMYILGEYITVLICYLIRDYKKLYICISCIMAVFPLYFWLVPESPRWLLTRGKNKKAYVVLKRIADSNNNVLPEKYETLLMSSADTKEIKENDAIEETKTKQYGFLLTLKIMFQSKKLLIRNFAIIFNWLTNIFVYYGLSMGSGQLAGNPYLNFTLLSTNELIAVVCSHFIFHKFGRKIPYVLNMGLGGLTMLGILFIPKNMTILVTIMALVGKFTISFTYQGIYIMSSELFPTVARATSMSICNIIARLGGVIAPTINSLGELYWTPIPFIIYGSFAIFSTILTIFFVPETKDSKLPDTVDDITG